MVKKKSSGFSFSALLMFLVFIALIGGFAALGFIEIKPEVQTIEKEIEYEPSK